MANDLKKAIKGFKKDYDKQHREPSQALEIGREMTRRRREEEEAFARARAEKKKKKK